MFDYKYNKNKIDPKKWELAKKKFYSRDEKQARDLGLPMRSTTIGPSPQYDYDMVDEHIPEDISINIPETYNPTLDEIHHLHTRRHPTKNALDVDENYTEQDLSHYEPEDFADIEDQIIHNINRHEKEMQMRHGKVIINRMSPKINAALLIRFKNHVDNLGLGHQLYNVLENKGLNNIDALDWHQVADWLEEHGRDSGAIRKYANKRRELDTQ